MQNLVGGLKGLVAYDETNIKVDIQLTATLGPLFISADADMRQSVDQQTNVVFPALAWQGDESNICIDEAQHPNEDIRVCVSSQNSLVELLDIQDMDLFQGANFVCCGQSESKSSPSGPEIHRDSLPSRPNHGCGVPCIAYLL
jgi:hypothetical protein